MQFFSQILTNVRQIMVVVLSCVQTALGPMLAHVDRVITLTLMVFIVQVHITANIISCDASSLPTDINECTSYNGRCQHTCHNVIGSYYCSCVDGYLLSNDSLSCDGK